MHDTCTYICLKRE